ncbi:SpoIID/LytB domain-containing protein [[Brevibacterium] frigoritolerans]|nr:SpoIID/LytB domain-containing protein [Peribacillus frigoritolerans]
MKKSTTYMLSIALTVSLLAPYESNVKAIGFSEPIYESPLSVRLPYASLQKPSFSFTLTGNYSIKGKSDLELTNGTVYTITNKNNVMELSQNGTILYKSTMAADASEKDKITIFPVQYDRNHYVKLGSYNFLGHITFRINGSNIMPVNTLEQEDYLLGVVAAEMSDSWGSTGIEALKAQAITARTYANGDLGKEIENGQSYQVYNGYNKNYTNVMNAVDSTRKQIIKYNNVSIDKNAVFSSSNGGTMLSKINSWGTASWNDIDYLSRNSDPFDARSASPNTNWNFTLEKNQISLAGLDLYTPEIWWNTTHEQSVDATKITSLKAFIKRYETQYKNFDLKIVSIDQLDFTDHNDTITNKTPLNGTLKISYLAYDPVTKTYVKNVDGSIKVLSFEKTTRTYDFYLYTAFGSGLMKSPNIKTSSSTSTQYVINGGGWGHAIGLSQWGAYQRAKEGQKYTEIISFYYPGTVLSSYVAPPVKVDPTPPVVTDLNTYHIVQSGETLWKISTIYKVPVATIKTLNRLASDTIKVGQKLIVKQSKPEESNPEPGPVVPVPEPTEPIPVPVDPIIPVPELRIISSMATNDIFSGTYEVKQKSEVSVKLNGPNGLKKLTFKDTMEPGAHKYGGTISQLPNGDYTLTITAKVGTQTVEKVTRFTKASGAKAVITQFSNSNSSFSGKFTLDQKAKVSIYLDGPNVHKFTYYKENPSGTHLFGGPLLSTLPSGTYHIKIETDNGVQKLSTSKEFYLNRGTSTGNTAGVKPTTTHKVNSGDTLWSISRKYGVSVNTLMSLNQLKTTSIKNGQILKVK